MACFAAIACALSRGQNPIAKTFEVASVKAAGPFARGYPSRRMTGGPGTASPGEIDYEEQSLKDLLFIAYRVPFYQLPTLPWMDSEYFSVHAKVPGGATRDDVCLMLQGLLAERFQLKLHHETREMPGYLLTVGTSRPAMQASPAVQADLLNETSSGKPPAFGLDKDGFVTVPPGYANMMTLPPKDGVIRLTASRATMDVLAGYLSRQLQRPVVDHTGLTGIYDFHLAFAPVPPMLSETLTSPSGADPGAPAAGVPEPAPPLIKAIESQLRLKMEPKRVPVDVLVIEHIERQPTEN